MIHLIKLSVGTESYGDLARWQEMRSKEMPDALPRHVTRMWPKREAEVLDGGSMYWVIKGAVLCRQRIIRLDEVIGHDGIRRCAIVLDPELVRTAPAPRRPFQGWRYLKPEDAPADLSSPETREELPPSLEMKLSEIGVL